MSTWFANARRRLKKENKMTWEPKNKLDDDDVDVSDDDDKDDFRDDKTADGRYYKKKFNLHFDLCWNIIYRISNTDPRIQNLVRYVRLD